MANKSKSVYLTARTMSSLRPDDSLSARMNVIVDRYLEAVARDRVDVRKQYAAKEWNTLIRARRAQPHGMSAEQQIAELSALVDLSGVTGGDLLVLLDLLDDELFGCPADTHSQGDRDDAR